MIANLNNFEDFTLTKLPVSNSLSQSFKEHSRISRCRFRAFAHIGSIATQSIWSKRTTMLLPALKMRGVRIGEF